MNTRKQKRYKYMLIIFKRESQLKVRQQHLAFLLSLVLSQYWVLMCDFCTIKSKLSKLHVGIFISEYKQIFMKMWARCCFCQSLSWRSLIYFKTWSYRPEYPVSGRRLFTVKYATVSLMLVLWVTSWLNRGSGDSNWRTINLQRET